MSTFLVAASREGIRRANSFGAHVLFYKSADGSSHAFTREYVPGWPYPQHSYVGQSTPDTFALAASFGEVVPAKLVPGEYLPRIWRGFEHPLSSEVELYDAEVSTRRVVADLCIRLERVFWSIEPVPESGDVFGHELRSLLILACTEVESSWKAILEAHNCRKSNLTTKEYFKLKDVMRLGDWSLRLESHRNWGSIEPFATWSAIDGKTTSSIPWYNAYNDTKHNREKSLRHASLRHVIDAVGAAYILSLAQFGGPVSLEDVFEMPLARVPKVFEVTNMPQWTAAEEYIAPIRNFKEPVGHERWTATHLELCSA